VLVAPLGASRSPQRTVAGPLDLLLFPTNAAAGATAKARLLFSPSPFGITVTEDGHSSYDVQITATGLPAPSSLGHFTTYVAWAATPELTEWVRLGPVTNGQTTVGPVTFNKFLLVISAESSTPGSAPAGPTVLHGTSPSGYIQSFLSHPLFRNVPQ